MEKLGEPVVIQRVDLSDSFNYSDLEKAKVSFEAVFYLAIHIILVFYLFKGENTFKGAQKKRYCDGLC